MSTQLESTIAAILNLKDVSLDAEGCHSNTLISGQIVHFRCFADEDALLVTLPLGQLRSDHLDIRAFFLLVANSNLYLTGGGAIGLDTDSQELYLSRQFLLGEDQADLDATLGTLGAFCLAGELARQFVDAVNALEPEDETTFPAFPADEATEVFLGLASDGQREEPAQFDADALSQYTSYVRETLTSLGIEAADPDEDLACYIESDCAAVAQLRLDPEFGELILSCQIEELSDDQCVEQAAELLGKNLFVEQTGGCVLGAVDDDPCQLSVGLVVSLDAVFPDPTRFANLVSGFLQNCEQLCESVGKEHAAAAIPEASPFQRFV